MQIDNFGVDVVQNGKLCLNRADPLHNIPNAGMIFQSQDG